MSYNPDDPAAVHLAQVGLTQSGYDIDLARALANRGIGLEQANDLSSYDLLDHYLQWEGIIGYTRSILEVVENINSFGRE